MTVHMVDPTARDIDQSRLAMGNIRMRDVVTTKNKRARGYACGEPSGCAVTTSSTSCCWLTANNLPAVSKCNASFSEYSVISVAKFLNVLATEDTEVTESYH